MSLKARNVPSAILPALVLAYNASRRAPGFLGTIVHADARQLTAGDHTNPTVSADLITTADAAVTLASVLTLVAAIKTYKDAHFADTYAHKTADTTTIAAAYPTDQATANAWLSEMKADLNTHYGSTTFHYTADSATIATADATDLATSIALANAIKASLNLHTQKAPVGQMIEVIPA